MDYLSGILLALYAIAVLSLIWQIRQTAALVGQGSGIATVYHVPEPTPSLDIVIPVKDEEEVIADCLQAVLAQEYPKADIWVVNDRSSDRTVDLVQALQDRHPEIKRLDVARLPEGLYGKPHALSLLAPKLSGDFTFFIDSDLRIKPNCLTTVAHRMKDKRLDWIAAMGQAELRLFWERVLVPIFGAMAYAWYDPRNISDPSRSEAIGSNFMVARREAYLAIGGHGAVVDQYDEDSALMRLAKQAGQRVEFVISANLFSARMYGDLRRTVRGFNRTLIGGLKTLRRFFITLNALAFVSLAPYFLFVLGLALTDGGVHLPWAGPWLIVIGVHVVAANILALFVYRAAGAPAGYAVLHPVGAIVAGYVCLRAAWDLVRRRPITWRGTSYQATGAAPRSGDDGPPHSDAAAV